MSHLASGLGQRLLSAAWAGFALTLAGLVLFLQISRKPATIGRAGERGLSGVGPVDNPTDRHTRRSLRR